MKYQSNTEYTGSNGGKAEPGTYAFIVGNAEETESRAGNAMIKLQLLVTPDGFDNPVTVYENLVFTDKALWKIEQFCNCVGLEDAFKISEETGRALIDLDPFDCLNKQGLAEFELNDKGYLSAAEFLEPASTTYKASPKQGNTNNTNNTNNADNTDTYTGEDIPF